MSKTRSKRKADELARERRRAQVAELYLQRMTQTEIARILGVSQPTVSRDIKAIERRWRQQAVDNLDRQKLRELAELDRMEREAAINYQHTHDIKWFRERKWIKEQRAKILGLYAPEKVAPTDPTGQLPYEPNILHVYEHVPDDKGET